MILYITDVDPLTTSVDGMIISSFAMLKLGFPSALNKIEAAAFPIWKAGWVIVVSDGLRIAAVSRFEKQTSFMS